MEIVKVVKKLNSISRARLNFRRRLFLCTTLYRNPMQASNFGGPYEQLFLWISLMQFSPKMRLYFFYTMVQKSQFEFWVLVWSTCMCGWTVQSVGAYSSLPAKTEKWLWNLDVFELRTVQWWFDLIASVYSGPFYQNATSPQSKLPRTTSKTIVTSGGFFFRFCGLFRYRLWAMGAARGAGVEASSNCLAIIDRDDVWRPFFCILHTFRISIYHVTILLAYHCHSSLLLQVGVAVETRDREDLHWFCCPGRAATETAWDLSHNSSRERGAKSPVGKKNRAKPETAPEKCARSVLSGAFSLLLFLCGVSASSTLSLRLGNWCPVTKVALWKALLRWQRAR